MNREKVNANYLLVIFSLVAIALLSLPVSSGVQAFRASVSYLLFPAPLRGAAAVDRLAAMPSSVVYLIGADQENQRMRQELKGTALIKAETEALRQENERLRAALGMKPKDGVVVRWARVMTRDPQNWFRFIIVAAGGKDGIEINAPVLGIAEGNLGAVGRVVEVGEDWSKVLLLTDELSSLAGYIPSKSWEGLVEGQGGARLRMNYLPAEATFSIGELVYTSATSATFPSDILVGSISKVFQRDPFLTFQAVEVRPSVNASGLKEVMILAKQRPAS